MAKTSARKKAATDRLARIAEATELAVTGYAFHEIATELKVTVEAAQELVQAGLAQIVFLTGRDKVMLEWRRLTSLVPVLYEQAHGGDRAAMRDLISVLNLITGLEIKFGDADSELFYAIKQRHKKIGGKPHVPDATTYGMVEAYAFAGYTHERIAELVGLSLPTLLKHYEHVVTDTKVNIRAEVEARLVKAVRADRPWAITFAAKTQFGYRETDPGQRWPGGSAPAEGEEVVIRGGLPDAPDGETSGSGGEPAG
jgi:hypothetical protein